MAANIGENPELLTIKALNATPDKVDRVVFHPVQPLIAYYERSSAVSVWNYESNEVVYTNQMGGADDGAVQEIALWNRAQKEASALGAPPPPPLTPAQEASQAAKTTASGPVEDIAFFDLDTCFWQIAAQQSLQYGCSDPSAIPSLSRARSLYGRRWLVTACDNKVTMHDISSSATIDLARGARFESKAPTRIAFLLMNYPSLVGLDSGSRSGGGTTEAELLPVLVVGTAAGSIYLVDPATAFVYAKLADGHKSAITALVPIAGEKLGQPDRLVSTDSSGVVAVWDPSRSPIRGADREISPFKTLKGHDNGIKSAAMYVAYDAGAAPEGLPPRLVTVGDDKKVALWNMTNWQCLNRIQPLPKASCHSVAFAPWGGAGLGVHPSLILASGDSTEIMGLDPATGDVTKLLDILGRVDPGQKKAVKIYHLAVHPTRPHLAAVGVNTGVGLLTFDPNERPAVVALPAQILTLEALLHQEQSQENANGKKQPQAEGAKGAAGFTYVTATGGSLWSQALRLETLTPKEPGGAATRAGDRGVKLVAATKEEIAKLDNPGRPVLACSPSGRSISAVWPEIGIYVVYTLAPTGTWEAIDRGTANCLVWSTVAPMYALIKTPSVTVGSPKGKKGFMESLGFGAKKHEEAQEEAMSAALAAAAAATKVEVHVVDEANASQFVAAHDLALQGAQPVLLHSGALLGAVVVNQETLERYMQFFSWKDFSPVGPPLAEPVWISWEPECTLAVLGYEHAVELCRTRPFFERFATLGISGSYSGLWQSRQLYVMTHNAIHLVFADPVQEFVQEITLSSFFGGVASKTAPPLEATPLPPEQMRPVGALTLAGVRHSYLWLADGFGRPFILSLRHPGIRSRCLAARGELTTARTIAERGLAPSFHDDVARFLAAMNPKEGVKEALLLRGIGPEAEMALCIRDGNWERAARSFQAFALGISDSILLLAATERAQSASGMAVDGLSALNITSNAPDIQSIEVARILREHERLAGLDTSPNESDNDDETDNKEEDDEESGSETDDDEKPVKEKPDPVNWDAALHAHSSAEDSEPTATDGHDDDNVAAAGSRSTSTLGPTAALSAEESRRVAHVTSVGIQFADAAMNSGHEDAARAALGVLVRYAPCLPPQLLEELISRIGQCKMTESSRNLARAAAIAPPDSPLRQPGVAALLAALVGGMHGSSVQATLHSAGLAPLSSVYAAVWGQGSEDLALAHWRAELAGQAGRVEIARPKA